MVPTSDRPFHMGDRYRHDTPPLGRGNFHSTQRLFFNLQVMARRHLRSRRSCPKPHLHGVAPLLPVPAAVIDTSAAAWAVYVRKGTTMVLFLRQNLRWLAAGGLLNFSSSFGQTFFIALFAGQIRADFALSHAAWGSIYTVATLASAMVMILAGGLADRFPVRHLGAAVLALLAVTCLAMAWVNSAMFLCVALFLLRFLGQGMATHLAVISTSRWFVATRGRALSIVGLGYSLGEGLLPVVCVWGMSILAWRSLWVIAAGVVVIIGLVLHRLLMNERSAETMLRARTQSGLDDRHWHRGEVMAAPPFWILATCVAGMAAFGTVFLFQQVTFAAEKGVPHLALAALFPLLPISHVAAMLISGAMLDRWDSVRLLPFYLLPAAGGFALFATSEALFGIAAGMALMGLTTGMNATVMTAAWVEFFGTRHIGSIRALAMAVMVLGSALGPGFSGILLDAGVLLARQYLGVALFFMLASAAVAIMVRNVAGRLLSAA